MSRGAESIGVVHVLEDNNVNAVGDRRDAKPEVGNLCHSFNWGREYKNFCYAPRASLNTIGM